MKQSCTELGPLITASLDDELNDAEWQLLERHLAACPECRERLRQEEAAVLRLEGLEPEATDRDLWPAVEPALEGAAVWPSLTLAAVLAGTLLAGKAVDLLLLDGAGVGLRLALVVAVAIGFVVVKINPFRLASAEELALAARGTSGQA